MKDSKFSKLINKYYLAFGEVYVKEAYDALQKLVSESAEAYDKKDRYNKKKNEVFYDVINGHTPLYEILSKHRHSKSARLAELVIDNAPYISDSDKKDILTFAVFILDVKSISKLIDMDAEVNPPEESLITMVLELAPFDVIGLFDMIELLKKKGADTSQLPIVQKTFLGLLKEKNYTKILTLLIEKEIEASSTSEDDEHSLVYHALIQGGRARVFAQHLIMASDKSLITEKDAEDILEKVSYLQATEHTFSKLMNWGANLSPGGQTLLTEKVWQDEPDFAALLVSNGAEMPWSNAKNPLLRYAIKVGGLKLAKAVLERDPSLAFVKNEAGVTLVYEAASKDYPGINEKEIKELLIEKTPSMSKKDATDILKFVIKTAKLEIIEKLIHLGANLNAYISRKCITNVAWDCERYDVVKLLIDNGVRELGWLRTRTGKNENILFNNKDLLEKILDVDREFATIIIIRNGIRGNSLLFDTVARTASEKENHHLKEVAELIIRKIGLDRDECDTILQYSVIGLSVEANSNLIEMGANVNPKDVNLVQLAWDEKRYDLVKLLRTNRAEVSKIPNFGDLNSLLDDKERLEAALFISRRMLNEVDQEGHSLLLLAVSRAAEEKENDDRREIAELVVRNTMLVRKEDEMILQYSIPSLSFDANTKLIDTGASLWTINGVNLVQLAWDGDRLDLVKLLLKAGAPTQKKQLNPLLRHAKKTGDKALAELVIGVFPILGPPENESGHSLFYEVVSNPSEDQETIWFSELLLEHTRSFLTQKDKADILKYVITSLDIVYIEKINKSGAKLNIPGVSLIQLAWEADKFDVVAFLIREGEETDWLHTLKDTIVLFDHPIILNWLRLKDPDFVILKDVNGKSQVVFLDKERLKTILQEMITQLDIDSVSTLIKKGAKINLPNLNLLKAVLDSKRYDVAELLIKKGADVSLLVKNPHLLMKIIEKTLQIEITKLVLDKLKSINTVLVRTAVSILAVIPKDDARLSKLKEEDLDSWYLEKHIHISKLIELDKQLKRSSLTLLSYYMGSFDINSKEFNDEKQHVATLVQCGAEISWPVGESNPLLHFALREGFKEMLEVLLKKAPELAEEKDKFGYRPVYEAIKQKQYSTGQVLIEHEAKKDRINEFHPTTGKTLLSVAIEYGAIGFVRLLLEKGANYACVILPSRKLAVQYAEERGKKEIATLLNAWSLKETVMKEVVGEYEKVTNKRTKRKNNAKKYQRVFTIKTDDSREEIIEAFVEELNKAKSRKEIKRALLNAGRRIRDPKIDKSKKSRITRLNYKNKKFGVRGFEKSELFKILNDVLRQYFQEGLKDQTDNWIVLSPEAFKI